MNRRTRKTDRVGKSRRVKNASGKKSFKGREGGTPLPGQKKDKGGEIHGNLSRVPNRTLRIGGEL